ncbi:D-2-hydroxyacid dehydrogenase [soil metagenome]
MVAAYSSETPLTIVIATPLEQEHVDRIAGVAPDRTRVLFRPDLLPPMTYESDHTGPAGWKRSDADEAEFRSLLTKADVLWDFYRADDAGPRELSPKLKWVQTSSAGVGQMVRRLGLSESDLIVTTASGVHGQPLTEFVFAALLYHVKSFPALLKDQASHHWQRLSTGSLKRKKLALIGPGRIGKETARIAKAFGMEVTAMARTNSPERAAELGVDRMVGSESLHELLGWADCIVLATPHTDETDQLINRAAIDAIKPGAILVNIARGAVIDEPAMIEALQSGKIGFAALDVVAVEPLPVDSPLWDMPNVLINPHSASTATGENGLITDIFVNNLRCFLDGRLDEMTPVLDKARLY